MTATKKLLFLYLLLVAPAHAMRSGSQGGGGISSISTNTTGADGFIWNTSGLQSGSTFYVSSGTVNTSLYLPYLTAARLMFVGADKLITGDSDFTYTSGTPDSMQFNGSFMLDHTLSSDARTSIDIEVSGTGTLGTGIDIAATSGSRNRGIIINAAGGGVYNRAIEVTAGDVMIPLLSKDCLGTDSGGVIIEGTCGGGSAIVFTTGTSSGYTQSAVSTGPTTVIFNQNQFQAFKNHSAGATVYYTADTSSFTLKGQPTGAPDGTKFLRDDWSWQTPAGSGDMVLASTQTVTGGKDFTSPNGSTFTKVAITGPGGGNIDLGNSARSAWLSLRSHTSLASDYNLVFPSTAGTVNQVPEIVSVTGSSLTLTFGNKSVTLPNLFGGVAPANVYDFGGATALELPNGSAPVIDTTGEAGVDTTAGQFIFFDGLNANVLSSTITESMTIETPAVGDYPFFFQAHTAQTVTSGICISSAATSATVQVDECDSAGINCVAINTAVACTTTGANFAITNSALDAGDIIRVKITAVSGTPGWTFVALRKRETRQ